MNILIDSSTLYSAIIHEGSVSELLDVLIETQRLVLTDYIVEEIQRNIRENVSPENQVAMLDAFNTFISGCHILEREEYINDLGKAENMVSRKDAPVLAAAMHPDVEYLLTSDKELQNIDTRKVKVLDVKQARELFL